MGVTNGCIMALLTLAGAAIMANALKCKCTQNSNRTPCDNGVCEVETDGSCLALDHPNSGRHYACSTSSLPNGQCSDKTTKSGQSVRVCSCSSEDFCNFRIWPNRESQQQRSAPSAPQDEEVSGTSSRWIHFSLIGVLAITLLSIL